MNRPSLFLVCILMIPAVVRAELGDADDIRQRVASLTTGLVKIPSVTGDERAVAEYLTEYARNQGLTVQRLDTPEGRPNVLISRRPLPSSGPNFMMLGHLDVVPVAGQSWTRPPWSGDVIDGELWGRGAVDNKGSLAIAIVGLEEYVRRHGTEGGPNITVLAVSGEEHDGIGAVYVAKHHLEMINPTMILGEGGAGIHGVVPGHDDVAFFGVASAEKSSLWLKVSLKISENGHGAVPAGDTSVLALVRALNRLSNEPFKVEFTDDVRAMLRSLARLERWPTNMLMRNPSWPLVKRTIERMLSGNPLTNAMIRNTATITEVGSDPGPPNVIPEKAWATLDCRLLPGQNEEEFMGLLNSRLKEPRATIEVIEVKPNVLGSSEHPFMEVINNTLEELYPGSIAAPIVFPASSDSNSFRGRGVPSFGVIPMVLDQKYLKSIHAADERIPIAGMPGAVEAVIGLIDAAARKVREHPELIGKVQPHQLLLHPGGHKQNGPCCMGFLGSFLAP